MPTTTQSAAMLKANRELITRTIVRLVTVYEQPWFASLAMRLQIEERDDIPTAATDGVHFFYNATWFGALDKTFQIGVLAHEISHCTHLHMTRRGTRDMDLWNRAGDHVINLELLAAGFKLPSDCLADKRFAGMTTEKVYAILKREQGEQGGAGSGGAYIDPLGGVMDAPNAPSGPSTTTAKDDTGSQPGPVPQSPPTPGPATKQDLEREWQQAAAQASALAKKAGKLPIGCDRGFRAAQSSTDYSAIMARYLTFPGDYSWSRPNRRFISSGLYLPGTVPDRPGTVVIAVDTSGSVDDRLLSVFAGEAERILNTSGWPEHVYIVYCDSKVHSHDELEHGAVEFHPKGGGGTYAQPVFDYVCEQGWEPVVLFYLTDLELGDTPRDPGYPVVWTVPLNADANSTPFGELAVIDTDAE